MASRDLKVFESYFLKPIPLVILALIIYGLFTADWLLSGSNTLWLFYYGWRWNHGKAKQTIQ